jgi:predicted aspartyl protease
MTIYNSEFFEPPAPLAKISIRNFKDKNRVSEVPMLLDTGADVSLIPTKFIESLNLSVGESSKLIGFDGNETNFQTIEAQIIFEGKRFTGKYFLIDQEYGILGRDILNSFTLLFDGIELNWSVISQT